MEKTRSFSQKTRITRKEGAATVHQNKVDSAEIRQKMIAESAYYLAEKRGFASHGAAEDWIKAEAEIDSMLHDRI